MAVQFLNDRAMPPQASTRPKRYSTGHKAGQDAGGHLASDNLQCHLWAIPVPTWARVPIAVFVPASRVPGPESSTPHACILGTGYPRKAPMPTKRAAQYRVLRPLGAQSGQYPQPQESDPTNGNAACRARRAPNRASLRRMSPACEPSSKTEEAPRLDWHRTYEEGGR